MHYIYEETLFYIYLKIHGESSTKTEKMNKKINK
jgi:hypothetical protein